MPFALYEGETEEAKFEKITVESTYEPVNELSLKRSREALESDGPKERRIVPAKSESDFPETAELDELIEMIRANNDMYPQRH